MNVNMRADPESKETSDTLVYRVATIDDCQSLETLINTAYRGPLSSQGWTNETDLVSAPRTSADGLLHLINTDQSVLLMFFGANDQILKGSVYLSNQSDCQTGQISLFVVRPDLQGRGYGKFILSTAENYARNHWNVHSMKLSAIVQRSELFAYYIRRGYVDTGQRQPFRLSEPNSGCILQDNLEIGTLKKCLKQ